MADIELFTVPGSHIGFGASLQNVLTALLNDYAIHMVCMYSNTMEV